jgi:hypothetical protein
MLTTERLEELLRYDPETGLFYWRINRNSRNGVAKSGSVAGCLRPDGRIIIGIDGREYRAHRLAFLYMTGKFPSLEVDHRDADPYNNAWSNLREATRSQQMGNTKCRNKHGFKGVSQHGKNCYSANICKDGRVFYLGTATSPEAAHEIYRAAALRHHGQFARMR